MRYDQQVVSKHASQPLSQTTFWAYLILVTQKLQVIRGHCTYRMSALLSEMSIFCVRAGSLIQMVSYTLEHASQSLSDKSFLHIQCT